MKIKLIAAIDSKAGIGLAGTIPWKLSADMTRFKALTTGKVVIMGRRTFASLNFKPLPNRSNIVISSTLAPGSHEHTSGDNYTVYPTLGKALDYLRPFLTYVESSPFFGTSNEDVYIIGGTALYEEAFPLADELLITIIDHDFDCDTFFPAAEEHEDSFDITSNESHKGADFDYHFLTLKRK